MLSEMARLDLESLRRQGFQPTDAEIIQLNDIACRIERGKETTPANHPRMAFAGSLTLHEPTIASIEWLNCYGKDAFDSDDGRLAAFYFALVHARDAEYLNTLTEKKKIVEAVRNFRRSADCTEDELWRALCWVKFGTDSLEDNPDRDRIKDSSEDEQAMDMLWMTVIAAAGAMGMTPDQLKTCTQTEMNAMLIHSNLHAHIPMKRSVAKDYIAYRQIIKSIEERKDNG